jgi:hypothetical protein
MPTVISNDLYNVNTIQYGGGPPGATGPAGTAVGFAEWQPGPATYNQYSIVSYEGILYYWISADVGNSGSPPPDDPVRWELVVGGIGATGAASTVPGATGLSGATGVGLTGATGAASTVAGATGLSGASGIGATGVGQTGATGVSGSDVSVANVFYVSKSGSDSNDGTSLGQSFLTIKAACAVATSGSTIFVKSGTYTENNPIKLPANVALVGDNLRTTTILPTNTTQDILWVNNGSYVTGFTFKNHISGAAAIAYASDGSSNPQFITKSPYIQNCTSQTTTGKGMYIDGSKVLGLKSMVTDSYTQFNQGGMGVHIDNEGYAQLVSIFTICTNIGVYATNGGTCSITNSNASFGTYGLWADGHGPLIQTAASDGVDQSGTTINIKNLTYKPNVGDGITFDDGTTWYTIATATALDAGKSSIVLLETIRDVNGIPDNTTTKFYKRSTISTSGHTMEYVGSGDNIATALPQVGGIPIPENQTKETNGGSVIFTTTDEQGNFRIGQGLIINRLDGIITGDSFNKSLFSILTPYILAIEG